MHLTLPKERAEKTRVWILIPAAGDQIHATFAVCLIRLLGLLRQHGITGELLFLPGDSLVTRARNNLTAQFLTASSDPDHDYSLWLDCDILFDPAAVLHLLATNLDFVCAPYSKKGIHLDRIAEAARLGWPNDRMMAVGGTPNVNWLVHPLRTDIPVPVLEAGTGFWLVRRKVYTQMIADLPLLPFRRSAEEKHYGDGYDFFRVGVWPETNEYISEDWWFCREWRRLGGTVYCCFWIKTQHIGPRHYEMDMPAIADLLTATGGYINAETRPTKESKDATTQAHGSNDHTNGNGRADRGQVEEIGHRLAKTGPDISRALAALLDVLPSDEAAGEGGAGSLGG